MKILIAHNYYLQAGGEDVVFKEEAKLLEFHGHQVYQCSMNNETINEMNSIEVGLKTIWNPDGYQLIRENIEKTNPDIVHFHNTFPLISPAGYEAAYDCKIPVVQTLHNYRLLCLNATLMRDGKVCELCIGRTPPIPGIRYKCYHEAFLPSATVAMMLTLHRFRKTFQTRVNSFIVLSKFAENLFIRAGIPKEKTHIKPNFIFDNSTNAQPAIDKKYFLFVGRLSQEKGILSLLEAVKKTQYPIKIVGSGPLENLVIQYINENNLSNCEYLGQVARDEVLSLMQGAIAIIIPSLWYEGFPMIIAEAFSQGTPILASRLGVLGEILDEVECGIGFSPGDSNAIMEAMTIAWKDLLTMEKFGVNAYHEFQKRFSSNAAYQSLLRIYETVIT
ncbi:MAG: glycosyltransferase family 4 protein [Anaerolineaceae bacterium]|nr:glycosyltransferase family 4 protein [Anaerolineaceae bacterium]